MLENMVSLKFPRLASRYQWKSKIVVIYAIFLGLVHVVGETYGEVSYIDNYIVHNFLSPCKGNVSRGTRTE